MYTCLLLAKGWPLEKNPKDLGGTMGLGTMVLGGSVSREVGNPGNWGPTGPQS